MTEHFQRWLKAILPTDGTSQTIGNVEFWIDTAGPWAGQLAFDLPLHRWDKAAITAELLTKYRPIVEQDLAEVRQ